jgi:hypothetical protein
MKVFFFEYTSIVYQIKMKAFFSSDFFKLTLGVTSQKSAVRLFAFAFYSYFLKELKQMLQSLTQTPKWSYLTRKLVVTPGALYILNNILIFVVEVFKFWHCCDKEFETVSPCIFIMNTKFSFKRNVDSMDYFPTF